MITVGSDIGVMQLIGRMLWGIKQARKITLRALKKLLN
jgi:hypothetical protein